MCRVSVFCCGCKLKSGAITAAVITGLSVLAYVIMGAIYFSDAGNVKSNLRRYIITTQDQAVVDKKILELRALGGGCLLNALLLLVALVCIIVGIIKEKARCILVWLVIDMIQIVSALIFAIVCLAFKNWVQGIFTVGISGFSIYMWIVVLSFYHELNEGILHITTNIKGIV